MGIDSNFKKSEITLPEQVKLGNIVCLRIQSIILMNGIVFDSLCSQ